MPDGKPIVIPRDPLDGVPMIPADQVDPSGGLFEAAHRGGQVFLMRNPRTPRCDPEWHARVEALFDRFKAALQDATDEEVEAAVERWLALLRKEMAPSGPQSDVVARPLTPRYDEGGQ